MAFIPTPNGVEVVINQTLHGEPLVNVLNFTVPEPNDGFTLAALANIVKDWWEADLSSVLSTDLVLNSVTARDISVANGQQVEFPADAGTTGGVSNGALPGNVAFVITHRTSFTGRSFRGRTYIAGLPEASVTGNALSGTVASGLAASFNNLRTTAAVSSFVFAVKSLYADGGPRAFGLATPVTVSVARDLVVDTQQRRLT